MTSSEQFAASRSGGSKQYECSNSSSTATTSSNATISKSLPAKSQTFLKPPECFRCNKLILDRYLLKTMNNTYHEYCLTCSVCNCRLGEHTTLFTKADLILCKRDYLRMFGNTGICAACTKQIPSFEMVMRAKSNLYHLDCFKCQASTCHQRFCVGDRFYLHENKILCEYDYEEQMALQQQRQFYQSLEQSTKPLALPSSQEFPSGPVMTFGSGPSHYP